MEHNSFKEIDENEATSYTNQYTDFVIHSFENKTFLTSLFMLRKENSAQDWEVHYGFKIAVNDLVVLMSNTGVMQWKIRFGMETPTSFLGILLIGTDNHGIRMTPYYWLKVPILDAPPIPGGTSSELGPNRLPILLAKNWMLSFQNNIEEVISSPNTGISNELVKAPNNPNHVPLRGYTMSLGDYMNEMFNTDQLESLNIYFVNHALAKQSSESQSQYNGSLGVIVSGEYKTDSLLQIFKAFYDISKPCPPTC